MKLILGIFFITFSSVSGQRLEDTYRANEVLEERPFREGNASLDLRLRQKTSKKGSKECFQGAEWLDVFGDTCSYYENNENACSLEGHVGGDDGLAAKEACCVCSKSNSITTKSTKKSTRANIEDLEMMMRGKGKGGGKSGKSGKSDKSDKSTKAPTIKSTKAPKKSGKSDKSTKSTKSTKKSTRANIEDLEMMMRGKGKGGKSVKSTKAPTIKSTKAPKKSGKSDKPKNKRVYITRDPEMRKSSKKDSRECFQGAEWFDSFGDTCSYYENNEDACSLEGIVIGDNGLTAGKACCACTMSTTTTTKSTKKSTRTSW